MGLTQKVCLISSMMMLLYACGRHPEAYETARPEATKSESSGSKAPVVESHPRDPSKPGDVEEVIPGYLTNPSSLQSEYSVDANMAIIRGDASTLDFGDEDALVVSLWTIEPSELYSTEANRALTEFVFDYGMRQSESKENALFALQDGTASIKLKAKLVAKGKGSKRGGFEVYGPSTDGLMIVSVATPADQTRLEVSDNKPGKIVQMVLLPGDHPKLIPFDRRQLGL